MVCVKYIYTNIYTYIYYTLIAKKVRVPQRPFIAVLTTNQRFESKLIILVSHYGTDYLCMVLDTGFRFYFYFFSFQVPSTRSIILILKLNKLAIILLSVFQYFIKKLYLL